jgi:hypothetical protein
VLEVERRVIAQRARHVTTTKKLTDARAWLDRLLLTVSDMKGKG